MKVLRDEDNDFKLSHLRDTKGRIMLGFCGENDFGGRLICLNMIDIILPTLIHELLHAVYPDKKEKQIEKEAIDIARSLTRRQRKAIFVQWMCRISEKEVDE